MKNKGYCLFLDDLRDVDTIYPNAATSDILWVLVRNVAEAKVVIKEMGLPAAISFDNDLGEGELEGYDFAKWLVEEDQEGRLDLPRNFSWNVHSANPLAWGNINAILENYVNFKHGIGRVHMNSEQPTSQVVTPPMIGNNMVFFGHVMNLHGYGGGNRFVADAYPKPGFSITIAYTFLNENEVLAGITVKQPGDRYVRKFGNALALERLNQAYQLLGTPEFDALKHVTKVTSTDAQVAVQELKFLATLVTDASSPELLEALENALRSIPIKSYRHDAVQGSILNSLVVKDFSLKRALYK